MVGSYYVKQKALTSFSTASARRTEHEIPKLRKRSRWRQCLNDIILLIMIKIFYLVTIFFCSLFSCYGQDYAQGIIYSAEVKNGNESKYELFSETGKKLLQNPVDWAYSNAWNWIFVISRKNNLRKVYNIDGTKLLIDSIESSKSVYTDLDFIALKKYGKWGFYDKLGNLKIGHLYDEVSNFNNNVAAIKSNGVIFFIDTNGVKVEKPNNSDEYNFSDSDIDLGMYSFSSPNYKVIKNGDKQGLSDAKGKVLIPAEYDDILSLKEHFQQVTVKRNNKYGIISFSGKVIIPINYESVIVLNDYLPQ